MVFALVVLIAAPFVGRGDQAHAGTLAVEKLPHAAESSFGPSVPLGCDWWHEQVEESSAPRLTQAAEPANATTPLDPGSTALTSAPPGAPVRPVTELAKVHRGHPLYAEARHAVPPAGPASLFLSGPRTQLPDPLLSRLFRPPR